MCSKLVSGQLLRMQLSMHMTKIVKCQVKVPFKPSSNMSLTTAIWCFRVDLDSGPSFSLQLVLQPRMHSVRITQNDFIRFYSPHLISVVLKSWNIQAGSASWTDRLSQKRQCELIWRFLADAVSLLTHEEVFSTTEGRWFSFSFNAYSIPQPLFINAIVLLQVQHDQSK